MGRGARGEEVKLILLGLLKPAVFVAMFALGASFVVGSFAPAKPADQTACFTTLVNAFEKQDSTGMWNCFDSKLQIAFYKGIGWKGDADIQKALFAANLKAGRTTKVDLFPGNPVKECKTDNVGNSVCENHYLFSTTLMDADGTIHQSCSLYGCAD